MVDLYMKYTSGVQQPQDWILELRIEVLHRRLLVFRESGSSSPGRVALIFVFFSFLLFSRQ